MNTDNTSNREAPNLCEVVSKYFSHNPGMDESSKNIKANQSTQRLKPKTNQAQKRPRKRPQGQKDIRTLIKRKKNELVSYSKDFELICKQSGIDVDPEQLQLAIALSKSLQDSTSNEESKTAKDLTAIQRKGKIRTTLQEYGFKVPEIKSNVGKKVKKYRKQYKLLLVSDNEKQQIIADKYAQILIRNLNIYSVNYDSLYKFDNSDSLLYNLSTSVSYKCMKNDDIFYIPDLIPKTFNERHVLLRDYSTIPGRPPSPVIDLPKINFDSIECSQEELCEILSGSIETAQSIVKKNYENNIANEINSDEIKTKPINLDSNTSIVEHKTTDQNSMNEDLPKEEETSGKATEKMALQTNRSYSPDIFDDEVTIIMDSSRDIAVPEGVTEKTMVREQNDIMDLTECVNIVNYNNTNIKQNSYLSQGSNKTSINPNDFMELTACVSASSQKTLNNTQIVHNGKENNNLNTIDDNCHTDNMDLTQSTDSNNSLQTLEKDTCGNKSLEEDTIIMIDEEYCNINADRNPVTLALKETEIIDLVTEQCSNPKLLDDIADHDAIIHLIESPENNDVQKKCKKNSKSEELASKKSSDAIDLTQTSKLEDNVPYEPVIGSGCSKTTSIDIVSNHDPEEDNVVRGSSEKNQNSPKDINCNFDNAPSPEINLDSNLGCKENQTDCSAYIPYYEENYAFDDPINDIPISPYRYPTDGNSENDGVGNSDNIYLKNENLEEINSTQSSNSDDAIKIANEAAYDSSGERPYYSSNGMATDSSIQDDTILLNDEDYCFNNLNNKGLGRYDDINKGVNNFTSEKRKSFSNLNEKSNHSNAEMAKQSSFDCDNDREFDNLLENVSNSKQSTSQTSISYDVDEDEALGYKNSFNSEIEADNNNPEFDLTQHSDYNNEKDSNPRNFEITHDLGGQHNEDSYNNKNDEIDLTQHSDSEETNYRQSNELGKRNISIDYDEVYIEPNDNNDCDIIFGASTLGNKEKGNSKDKVSSSSQTSEVFEISDNEFNYSTNQHEEDNDLIRLNDTKFDIGGMSIINEFLSRKSASIREKLSCSCSNESNSNESRNQSCLVQDPEYNEMISNINEKTTSCTEVGSVKISTPSRSKSDNVLFARTPKHNDYIIKTDQVTPMPKYEVMSSPERNEELDKYGIKPLKRKRAIQILTHIYNQTHPVMEIISDSESCSSPSKIRKKSITSFPRRAIVSQIDSKITENCQNVPGPSLDYPGFLSQETKSRKGTSKNSKSSPTKNLSPEYSKNDNKENNLYEETKQLPDIRDIECSSEEWVFQKREKTKVHSCRVPLHIAFHNYVSCRRGLREAILRYEPINIDDIHKGLVAIGYRYNPKDLLKFMDKKCITVKTADNARNNKK